MVAVGVTVELVLNTVVVPLAKVRDDEAVRPLFKLIVLPDDVVKTEAVPLPPPNEKLGAVVLLKLIVPTLVVVIVPDLLAKAT